MNTITELMRTRTYDSAEYILKQIIPAIRERQDSLALGKAYAFSHDFLWYRDEFDSAITSLNKALQIFKALNEASWIGFCHNEFGLDYLILGQFDKSVQHTQTAIDTYREVGDTIHWAHGLSHLSNVNHDIAEYDKGIAYGRQALELFESHAVGDPDLKAYAINCIAINHDDKGEHEKAIEWHMKVIDMMPEMQERSKPRTYNNIGNSLMKLERYDEAIVWLKKNLELNEKFGRRYGLATVKTNLGTLSYLNKEFINAKTYLDEAEIISYEINDVEKIHDVLFQQYMLYKEWGKYEKSLSYMEKFHHLKDSLLNESKSRQLTEMQTKYETELKEKEIENHKALLAKQDATIQRNQAMTAGLGGIIVLIIVIGLMQRNRLILKQKTLLEAEKTKTRETQIEAALNSQETERKRFARDLHDGFGQMISVLNLNLKALEKGTSSKEDIFENSSKVLDDMYKELKGICFNLMPETLIKSGVLDALREFANRVNQTGKVFVEIDSFGIDKRLDDLQEISIYRITQEWVNNMLKYSDADKVTVSLTKDEEEITLLIEDNGSGFDKKDLINGNGNGWKNMNSRANLIKGELELDT
ncbi:MAG: tetratricopeptide repeat protein, partial [Cyclobacteriaceae bacterium]